MQTKNHIEIFISYASQDEKLREELYMYLTSLQRNKPISFWSTYDMIAGRETAEQIRSHLNAAHIILLLVSSYSLSSDTIYQQQILLAMERARTEHVMLIPVLLRSISWKDEPFGKLPALPTNEVPITLWGNRDAAWDNVMQGIRQVIDTLLQSTPPQSALIAPVKEGTSPMANASSPAFDVFLCYNGQDRDAVKKIGLQLKDRGIKPWLDVWELRPGLPWLPALEQQIANINSVAVFVGKGRVDERGKITALAPWQQMEANAALQEFVRRGCPVIPVVLEGAPEKPQLPLFLRAMHWIDFRKDDPDPLDQLAWGITGIQNSDTA